jgi:hypothetical protein
MTAEFWTTRDGRRLKLKAMDDEHILNILRMGVRAQWRKAHREAMKDLTFAYAGDGGCEYLGDVQYEDAMRKAADPKERGRKLALSPLYAPLLQEAKRRGLSMTRRAVV